MVTGAGGAVIEAPSLPFSLVGRTPGGPGNPAAHRVLHAGCGAGCGGGASVAGTLVGGAILQCAVELSDRGLAGLHRLGAVAAEVVRRSLQLGDGPLQCGDGARDARMLAALLAGAGAGRGERERQDHEAEDHEQLGDVALHTLSLSCRCSGSVLLIGSVAFPARPKGPPSWQETRGAAISCAAPPAASGMGQEGGRA